MSTTTPHPYADRKANDPAPTPEELAHFRPVTSGEYHLGDWIAAWEDGEPCNEWAEGCVGCHITPGTSVLRFDPELWHNPENVPLSKLPKGYRLLRKEEFADASLMPKARLWVGGEWLGAIVDRGAYVETFTYCVPIEPPKPAINPGEGYRLVGDCETVLATDDIAFSPSFANWHNEHSWADEGPMTVRQINAEYAKRVRDMTVAFRRKAAAVEIKGGTIASDAPITFTTGGSDNGFACGGFIDGGAIVAPRGITFSFAQSTHLVSVDGRSAPTHEHKTEAEARTEAERLARIHVGRTVRVLRQVATVTAETKTELNWK